MKSPGLAWLQWEARPEREGTRLTQTAGFAPQGLAGAMYWYVLYPFHRLIFTDMIEAIGRLAVSLQDPRHAIPPRHLSNARNRDVAAEAVDGNHEP